MEPVDVVARYFDGWRRGDTMALIGLLDPRVRATGPLATVDGAANHAESLARSSRLFSAIAVDQMAVTGDTVITWFAYHLTNGEIVQAANRCEVAGNVITSVQVAFDPRPLLSMVHK
jgi:ketosteroid isomerase-like protein